MGIYNTRYRIPITNGPLTAWDKVNLNTFLDALVEHLDPRPTIPATALLEEAGSAFLDEAGAYFLEE